MSRDDLPDLAAFLAVAEERSFTRAAARLGVSQSTLSHTMRRLEERIGVRLLTRTTRSVAPTEAGERMVQTLRPALASIDEQIIELVESRDKPAGSIRITTSRHAAQTVLWPTLASFLPRYPDIHVELSINSGFANIVNDRFDAGVRLGEALAKDMIAVRISPDLRMVVVGSPDYLARYGRPQTPQDLADHRCINLRLTSSGGFYTWEMEQADREIKVRVDGQLAFNDVEMIIGASKAGFGLCYVMEDQVADAISRSELEVVLSDWCAPFPGYYLYYPSRRQNSAAFNLLANELRNNMRNTYRMTDPASFV